MTSAEISTSSDTLPVNSERKLSASTLRALKYAALSGVATVSFAVAATETNTPNLSPTEQTHAANYQLEMHDPLDTALKVSGMFALLGMTNVKSPNSPE